MDLTLRAQSSVSEKSKDSLYLLDLHVQESATNLVGSLVAASLSDFTGKPAMNLYFTVMRVREDLCQYGCLRP